jgi:hypothetical protein
MKRRTFATVIFAAGLLPLTSTVQAQVAAPGVQAQVAAPGVSSDQSVAQGAVIPPKPPEGFNAATASPIDLALYGFPPAPPAGSPGYSQWLNLVSPSMKRITPTLQQTVITNGPAQIINAPAQNVSSTGGLPSNQALSLNWSGYAQVAVPNSHLFTHNDDLVLAQWILPKAQQAFAPYACDGTWWYSSQWVGFDGFNSPDVLQAGTEADALCLGGTTYTFYSAWWEWAPGHEMRVSLPVSGGDYMGVEVWYTTVAPNGHAYIVDYTSNTSTSISFNPPPNTVYEGNSVEWIEERPEVNGGLANLTNYVADPFNYAYAYTDGGARFYPAGVSGIGATTVPITMVCTPLTWYPNVNCPNLNYPFTTISTPSLYGSYTLWFYNSPPSY